MSKLKVTLSLDPGLLHIVDAAVKHDAATSRSAVVEEALRLWKIEQRRRSIEQAVEAYYRTRSPKELREDQQWATIASRAAKQAWED